MHAVASDIAGHRWWLRYTVLYVAAWVCNWVCVATLDCLTVHHDLLFAEVGVDFAVELDAVALTRLTCMALELFHLRFVFVRPSVNRHQQRCGN